MQRHCTDAQLTARSFRHSEPIHPPGTLEQYLPKDKHLGPVDMSSVVAVVQEVTQEEKDRQQRIAEKPSLDECLSLYDFEASGPDSVGLGIKADPSCEPRQAVAKSVLPTGAWAYYSSGADDEITMRENRGAYQRIWFRPRVLRGASHLWKDTLYLNRQKVLGRCHHCRLQLDHSRPQDDAPDLHYRDCARVSSYYPCLVIT